MLKHNFHYLKLYQNFHHNFCLVITHFLLQLELHYVTLSIMLHSIIPTLCPRYTGVKPDIWLGLVSYASEAYPMLMGKGSSARYEEMKQRGTPILKTFIIYSIFSYVQHGRIHHIKCRWSLALTLALVTLTTLLTGTPL